MNFKPIYLEGYGAAVFLADMEFSDRRIDTEYVPLYKRSKAVYNEDGSFRLVKNPDYPYKTKEEEQQAKKKHDLKRADFIYKYLKEEIKNNEYAERFKKEYLE